MRRLLLPLLPLVLLASPAAAQQDDLEEGLGLIERGMDLMMRRLLDEMGPTIEDAEGTLRILEGVLGEIDRYEAPEVLPNGDIIIRRKPEVVPELAPEDGEIEL